MKKYTETEIQISNQIVNFLESHPAISKNHIEKMCRIQQASLCRAINQQKIISPKYHLVLMVFLEDYGLKIECPNC